MEKYREFDDDYFSHKLGRLRPLFYETELTNCKVPHDFIEECDAVFEKYLGKMREEVDEWSKNNEGDIPPSKNAEIILRNLKVYAVEHGEIVKRRYAQFSDEIGYIGQLMLLEVMPNDLLKAVIYLSTFTENDSSSPSEQKTEKSG